MKEKIMPDRFFKNSIRAGYYPLLFLLSCIWMLYYNPGLDKISIVSFIVQQAALFSLLQIADTLLPIKKVKYSLAGISAIYIFLLHLNAFLISITSMTLHESLAVLATGGDFLYTLEEAGLSTGFIILLVIILLIIASAGGLGWKFIPHTGFRKKSAMVILMLIFILPALFFIAEQNINRNSVNFFSRRLYPLYLEIFSSNNNTQTFSITEDHLPDMQKYADVSRSANPKNVIFILLESFRSDSINSELSPFIKELASDSLQFTNYYTDAIYTSLAWNTLLMDRPGYTLSEDIDRDRKYQSGSGILRIFKNAGYETYAAFSANMKWKNFYERVHGKDKLIDNYFCGYERRDEERNFIDNRTSSITSDWIKKPRSVKPFFMMIQLDSTHWTYYADSENQISKPFAGKDINIGKLRNYKDIELLENRYKNSVRQVNSGIKKIITALKQSGKYNDTVIVIVSDHGEGFAPGMIGHSVMHDDIKKPAFMMRLPGVEKFNTDKFISHMNIFPTLFDYLKISGTAGIMRGKSIFDKNNRRESVLSIHGSIMLADISFKDYTVYFRVKRCKDSISFTPVNICDRKGNILKDHDNAEWKSALQQIFLNNK